jgi:hypothetical protein
MNADDDGITKANEHSSVSKFFALKRDNAASTRSRWHRSDNSGQQGESLRKLIGPLLSGDREQHPSLSRYERRRNAHR